MSKKLYFIPGTMCNEKLWEKVIPYLDPSIESVYLTIPQKNTVNEIVAHYKTLFGNDRISLIGFSLGGYIATSFATLHPDSVERLFVISNSPSDLSPEELAQRKAALALCKAHGYKGLSRKKIASLFDIQHRNDRLIDIIIAMDKKLGEAEMLSQYEYTSKRTDLRKAIAGFPFPSYFYYSSDDKLVNPLWFKNLTTLDSNLTIISTAGTGHMLPLEKPQELAEHINQWLEL